MAKIAFVDTETTGLNRRLHDMWELAMEVYEVTDAGMLGRQVESVHIFTMPVMADADPTALRMNKFYQRTNEPSFEWAADEYAAAAHVAQILGTDDCHVAGMQVDFDLAFIEKWLRENGEQQAWHYHAIELESFMVGAIAASGSGTALPWKSDNLSKSLGIEPPSKEQRHTAVGDAQWCVRVWESVMGSERADSGPGDDMPEWALTEGSEA